MRAVIFMGPTLGLSEASSILPATYLRPAASGDIECLLQDPPAYIGLIDGYFEHRPAVFHKEILHALSLGVHVFGAASMGALRAAELAEFGMKGVGAIFEHFRDGVWADDDEVAVAHGVHELSYVEFSVAMANIRFALADAREAGILTMLEEKEIVSIVKKVFYMHRDWQAVFEAARQVGANENGLRNYIGRFKPNQKRVDALQMLNAIKLHMACVTDPHIPAFTLSHTTWLNRLQATGRIGMEG